MAKIIEFYVPKSFRRATPKKAGKQGLVIEFAAYTKKSA
jgi:hypothetical protein